MSSLSREIVFLILKFLDEEKFKEAIHKLEQESGFFFNIMYFEELVINGDWDEVEKYLSGFTEVGDNKYSTKIFFEIRKQKYFEALDRKDWAKAVDILRKDLNVFSDLNENLFKEVTQLLTLEDFRENEQLSQYGDINNSRRKLFDELQWLIQANPLFHNKLNFPHLNSRLQTLIGQRSLVDPSVANPRMDAVLGAHGPFQPVLAVPPTYFAGLMDNPSVMPHPSASANPIGFTSFSSPAKSMGFTAFNSRAAILEHPGIPPMNNSAVVYQTEDSEHVRKGLTPSVIPDENDTNRSSADEKSRNAVEKSSIADESVDNSRIWKLTEINEPSQCRSLKLPDNLTAARVSRLVYTKSGLSILALAANAVHKLWKWPRNDENITGKATASVVPQLWKPSSGILMTNDISDTNPEDAVPCLAISPNGSYVMSASGGEISLYNLNTFETIEKFAAPPPTPTYIAFYPQDNNIIAVGMDNSTIEIFYGRLAKIKSMRKVHQERITGLAFSNVLNVLVSSGADSRLCVWSTDGWKIQKRKLLKISAGRATVALTDTCIQFHHDQTRLLAVHSTQIAIYRAPMLELLNQWIPAEAGAPPITHATYSCDSQSIYVVFDDGSMGILTASASLQLRCVFSPTSYLPANPSSGVHPLVIAAHPSEPDQFALGLSDGGVCIVEPLESEGKWGRSPPPEDGAGPSTTAEVFGSSHHP